MGKIWYQKKVSEPALEKFGTGTEFCHQYFGIFKSTGIGIGNIWYQKKYQYRLKFWVPSHTDGQGSSKHCTLKTQHSAFTEYAHPLKLYNQLCRLGSWQLNVKNIFRLLVSVAKSDTDSNEHCSLSRDLPIRRKCSIYHQQHPIQFMTPHHLKPQSTTLKTS